VGDSRQPAPVPEPDSEIVGADWYGEDLSGHDHIRVALSDVEMTQASARAARFTECNFRDCTLNSTRFTDTAFLNCTFTRCSFFDAHCIECKLVGSSFEHCRFGAFTCERGDWSLVALAGADLRRARFIGVRMREADLTGAKCAKALLRDLDLSGASLQRADLSGADLRGSELSSLDPLSAQLRGAIVDPDQTIAIAAALGLDVRPNEEPL
jgi:fluoroquinolone resistance protein